MELQLIEPVISGRSPFVFDKKNLILGDKIGAGYFGEVMSGKLNGDTHVALKLLKEGRGSRYNKFFAMREFYGLDLNSKKKRNCLQICATQMYSRFLEFLAIR